MTVYFHINGGDIRTVTAERGTKIEAPQVERADVEVDGILFSSSQLTGWEGMNGYTWDGTATPMNDWQSYLELWAQWETKDCLLETAQEGPVEFTTAAQLAQLAKNVEAGQDYAGCRFILAQDVTLTSSWRTPIGSYDKGMPFSGEFQAANGARIILDNALYPLFGCLGADAQVSGMTVTGTATQIESGSGGLVMWNGGNVSNITAENLVLGHVYTERVGGIVGWNLPGGVVGDCTLSGSSISGRAVGGIVATNGGVIRNCETDGASSVATAGNINTSGGNYDYISGYCRVLGAGGIAGINIRGTVESCQNSASVTAQEKYSVVGGVLGIWRGAADGLPEEKGIIWSDQGSLLNCTNQGSIQVSASNPIVGGVLGMYSDTDALFTGDTISGASNFGDIQVKNTNDDEEMRHFATVGGVIGKLRMIEYLDWDTKETVSVTGLTHNGRISAENCNDAGGILGGSYGCTMILRDCAAKGELISKDTDYVGGIFGCAEFHISDPYNYMFDSGRDQITIDRCTAEVDIQADGTAKFVGGIAASREERVQGAYLTARFNPITITDSGHYGTLTAPEGTGDGVCPINCTLTRSWHGSKADALVVIDSTAEDGGRYKLPAGAITSGQAAWLLDGGEGSSLGIWTQGDLHPVPGQPAVRRISVQSSENGSVAVEGASEVYAAIGNTLQVSAQPSQEIVEQDGVKYCYVLENVTLTWMDEEGNIQEADITDTMSFTVPNGNASLTARFTLEELPPEEEPEEEDPKEEQPDTGTGNGSGTGSGNGTGTGGGDTGTGTGTETGDGDTGTETGTGEPPAEEPSPDAGTSTPEPSEEPGSAATDTQPAEGAPESSKIPEEQEPIDLPVPLPEGSDTEIPDELPPMAGIDVTGNDPAISPISPAEPGAAGGQGADPRIFELIPEPLREPHMAAVLLGLLALLAAGVLWQGRKYRKDR